MNTDKKNIILKILIIITLGFFFNLLWEVSHSLLYDWDVPPLINNIYVYIPRIIFFATGFDAFWIFTFILWNSLLRLNFKWIWSQKNEITLPLLSLESSKP